MERKKRVKKLERFPRRKICIPGLHHDPQRSASKEIHRTYHRLVDEQSILFRLGKEGFGEPDSNDQSDRCSRDRMHIDELLGGSKDIRDHERHDCSDIEAALVQPRLKIERQNAIISAECVHSCVEPPDSPVTSQSAGARCSRGFRNVGNRSAGRGLIQECESIPTCAIFEVKCESEETKKQIWLIHEARAR